MLAPPLPLSHSPTLAVWVTILLGAVEIREPLVPLWVMELLGGIFLYAWLFCVGASVGSFFNVVVYRLPRGLSLVQPGSFCPRCQHSIRLIDNIPLVSWLVLRGRCRHCGGAISPRYFWVELAVATMFLGVALVETKLSGNDAWRNLGGVRSLISPYETLPFWSNYTLHVLLLTTLLGAALIDLDGFRTPGRMFVPIVAMAVALPLFGLGVEQQEPGPEVLLTDWKASLARPMAGWVGSLALAALIGMFWSQSSGHGWPKFEPVGLLVAVGVVIGWRPILEVGAASMLAFAAAMFVLRVMRSSRIVPLAALVLVATLPRLLELDARLFRPLDWPAGYEGIVAGGCMIVAAVSALVAGRLAPPAYFESPAVEPVVEMAPPEQVQ